MVANVRKILGAVAVAVLASLLVPILFGEAPEVVDRKGGDTWRNWIYDFQTLITGLAAVGAATATIWMMDKTDRRQAERHRELVALTQRSDLRRLSRAIEPQLDELIVVSKELDAVRLQLDPIEAIARYAHYRLISEIAPDFQSRLEMIVSVLERPQFRDGSELFDGYLTYTLESMYERSKRLIARLGNHIHAASDEDANYSFYYDEEFDGEQFKDELQQLRSQLRSVIVGLTKTKNNLSF